MKMFLIILLLFIFNGGFVFAAFPDLPFEDSNKVNIYKNDKYIKTETWAGLSAINYTASDTETKTIYDKNGNYAGKMIKSGDTIRFYDKNGNITGSLR